MVKTMNGTRYPEELRARAVRMVLDHESEYANRDTRRRHGCAGAGLGLRQFFDDACPGVHCRAVDLIACAQIRKAAWFHFAVNGDFSKSR